MTISFAFMGSFARPVLLAVSLVFHLWAQEDVQGKATAFLEHDQVTELGSWIATLHRELSDPREYASAINTITMELASHPKCDRVVYGMIQEAASPVLAMTSPDALQLAYRVSLSLTRTNRYLRDMAPEEWRVARQRNCLLLGAFSRRLAYLTDPAFDPTRLISFEPPEGLVLPAGSSDALPSPDAIPPASRAAYVKALAIYQDKMTKQRQQTQVRSVWRSFRKDLITYLVNSHVRHPTDFHHLAAIITICGLEEEREAIMSDVSRLSGQPIPETLKSVGK